jgi:hypothetical protein
MNGPGIRPPLEATATRMLYAATRMRAISPATSALILRSFSSTDAGSGFNNPPRLCATFAPDWRLIRAADSGTINHMIDGTLFNDGSNPCLHPRATDRKAARQFDELGSARQ